LLCAEEKLSAKRFAEYLSLAQVPDLTGEGAPPAAIDMWTPATDDLLSDTQAATEPPVSEPPPEETGEHEPLVAGALRAPWRWEKLLVEAAVIGGRDRWERRLKGLAAEIDGKIEALKLEEPDSPQVSRLERQREDLVHLRRFAMPVLEVLKDLPEEATWGEWLALLQAVATRVLRQPQHVLSVLAELEPLATVGPVRLHEVREALSTRLTQLAVDPPRSRYGRVFVATPEQLRGRSFSLVFVPGLAERIFPQKLREDPLLLDGDRQQLAAADPPLMSLPDRASGERLRLRMIAGAAEQKVFFSYPRVEVALARPRVPSFYALDVRRTTLGSLPNVEEFERESARNSGAELAWLAPGEPSAAIDDIEHDLAVLRPLLKADPKSVRGSARYLMELSPELGRSLRTRWQRWQKKWSAADGICEATPLTKQQLGKYRLSARAFSPTSLQLFAACPYRFLLSAVHGLSPREESVPLELLDPLTKGRMYHSIVARFLREAVAEKMLPISVASLANAQSLIDRIVAATAAEYHEQLAPAIERVWEDEIESLRADLRGWLTQMAENQGGYVPELIEFAFGLPAGQGRDSASTTQPATLAQGFQIHGIVDLVERNGDGEWRVTDHKTGKNRIEDGMVVGGGEVLQPTLYSLSIENLTSISVKEARLSFCTAVGAYSQRTVSIDALSRHSAMAVLRMIDGAIEAGFLPAAPKKEGCKWCDFVQICGPNEQVRVGRKEQTALDELIQLRQMR
jgi:CRISPR/Cas system-associated exonuclease Cas4 (RecB family)